ncbi:MAG: T9SS type A sorting domain-containing protein [Bacteroidetes bacterium]|nr:T9SS type A sorting domain-containing protein [Bacteroidota bacterium]
MKKLLTIFIMIITTGLYAQEANWVLYNYPVLPTNSITCVEVDHTNRVWVGTGIGAAVKMGDTWKKYSTAHGLPTQNQVSGMAFGTDGQVWLACGGGMATTYDSVFTSYTYLNAPIANVKFISVTLATDGTMYCGTLGAGVFSFDGTNWMKYNSSNTSLTNDTINGLSFDTSGNLWVSTQNGLNVFDGENWINYQTSNSDLPENRISNVTQGPDGSIWVCTDGGGLAEFDGQDWVVFNNNNTGQPLINWTTDVAFDENGILWLGTYIGGLYTYDGSFWTQFMPNTSPLPDITVRSVAIDNNGMKWMATPSGLSGYSGGPNGIFDRVEYVRNDFFSPNPADNRITLSSEVTSGQLKIFTLTGKLVMEMDVQNDRVLDISILSVGSYMVTFNSDKHNFSNLLFKQ